MKIAFNGVNSGFSNNGGSRTIILSSQILEDLGHRCDIIGTVDRFTWFDHKPILSYFPSDLDVVINIAAVDYTITRQLNVPIKAAWWRAHESWSVSDYVLGQIYGDTEVLNIVNSKGLQYKLKTEYDADSVVVYQGIDFDWWRDLKTRSDRDGSKSVIRIGCLHTKQPRKRWKDFIELANILGTEKYEYVGMGSATPHNKKFLTEFIENANVEQLNKLYSSCHIWFAPTESEGLHNVPMEAALCGCLVVCSDHKLNGMSLDYAFDDKTAMIYEVENIEQAAEKIRNPNWNLVRAMQEYIKVNIGTRVDNMRKMVRYLNEII